VAARLARLRAGAPFGALAFREVRVLEGGRRAEAAFIGPAGEAATVWLAENNGRAEGGYRVGEGSAGARGMGPLAAPSENDGPTPALREGLRAVMEALKPRLPTVTTIPA
jgi:hypothetical protein